MSDKLKEGLFLLEGAEDIKKHPSFDKLFDMVLSKYGLDAASNVCSADGKVSIFNSRQAPNKSASGEYIDKKHVSCEISLLNDGDCEYLIAKVFSGTCFLGQSPQFKDSCSVNGALYVFNNESLEVNRVTYDVGNISGISEPKSAVDNYKVEFPVTTIVRGGVCDISNLGRYNQRLKSGVDVDLTSIARRKPTPNGYSNYDFFADVYHNKRETDVNGVVQYISNSEFVYCNPVNDPSNLDSLIVIGTKDGVPQPGREQYKLEEALAEHRTESQVISTLCNNSLPQCSAGNVMPYSEGMVRK